MSEFRGVIRGCRTGAGDCSGAARFGDSLVEGALIAEAPTPLLRLLFFLVDILESFSGIQCSEVDVRFVLRVGVGMIELTSRLSTRPLDKAMRR